MTIAEVSREYGLTPDTLRYYERIGLLPRVKRTGSGIRDYGESDCAWISYIKCMRNSGVSIDTLTEYVRLFYIGDETIPERKQLLVQQREEIIKRISDLNDVLARLNDKIKWYDECVTSYEKQLK